MTKAKGRPQYARSVLIVSRQEKLAERLLDRALEIKEGVEPDLIVQLDVFEKIGKWISIKNRLEDQGETQIDSFKRRIHAQEAEASQGRRHNTDRLEALKQRLPDRSHGGPDGNSDASGGEVPTASG
jgi:hypothetical protein